MPAVFHRLQHLTRQAREDRRTLHDGVQRPTHVQHGVAHNLGFTAESGARFLLRYGKGTRAMLVDFRAWLDGLPLDAADVPVALGSAAETFAAVERWHRALDLRG